MGPISRADWIKGVKVIGQDDGEELQPLMKDELDLHNRWQILRRNETGVLEQHRSEISSHNDGKRRATGEASSLKNGVEGHWIEYWDDEVGASYYFNSITGEASWVNPEEESRSINSE